MWEGKAGRVATVRRSREHELEVFGVTALGGEVVTLLEEGSGSFVSVPPPLCTDFGRWVAASFSFSSSDFGRWLSIVMGGTS